jgi:hypothetical protein
LNLNTLAFDLVPGAITGLLQVALNGVPVSSTMSRSGDRITLTPASQLVVSAGQTLVATIASAAPKITSLTLSASGSQLTWQSVPGKTYTVQSTDTLAGVWQMLKTGVVASSGATTSFTDVTAPGHSQRFYRILVESQ